MSLSLNLNGGFPDLRGMGIISPPNFTTDLFTKGSPGGFPGLGSIGLGGPGGVGASLFNSALGGIKGGGIGSLIGGVLGGTKGGGLGGLVSGALGTLIPGGGLLGGVVKGLLGAIKIGGSPVSVFNRHGRGYRDVVIKDLFGKYSHDPGLLLTHLDRSRKFALTQYAIALKESSGKSNSQKGIQEGINFIKKQDGIFNNLLSEVSKIYNVTTGSAQENVSGSEYPGLEANTTTRMTNYTVYRVVPKPGINPSKLTGALTPPGSELPNDPNTPFVWKMVHTVILIAAIVPLAIWGIYKLIKK